MAEKMELRKSLRRKFSGNIRSPVQWKKRWCILSEYCLFYYKGPEEEKCLGSILLPSYKIRPCTADDKGVPEAFVCGRAPEHKDVLFCRGKQC
ncbi:hypothetical protein MRX96_054361 [Rhipicephalus microplus]